ncbi:MAG: tRNA-dihydrouridine synthase [Bacteriovoracaceae bacterium]
MHSRVFSKELQAKIDACKPLRQATRLGSLSFDSPLLLAPMAGICTSPFRLLMEDLGAGATVSELISAHGVNHGNQRTLGMLKIDEREKNVGIQLFGDEPEAMACAARTAQEFNPKFIDINMGCPVRKVVTKGGGSALMKEIEALAPLFSTMKKAIKVPLSIKIRMGWDAEGVNADKIEEVARNEGVEWVAIHGRTRAQQYRGAANWEYIESFAQNSRLPVVGNGDLHQAHQVAQRLKATNCAALMIARGCLRNPFIFLESLNFDPEKPESSFKAKDYFEVIERLYQYCHEAYDRERTILVQVRKLIVWFAAGFPSAAKFRNLMFQSQNLEESMRIAQDYFLTLGEKNKKINYNEIFMNGGHG